MPFIDTDFDGVKIFEPRLFGDDRGYFMESYNQHTFTKEGGIPNIFVQDNQAKSGKGVLRGLHYQVPPFAQAKLVRVLEGEVLDVIVDIRKEQPTYGQWLSVVLSAQNKRQLFVPRGFAHGYLVLSDTAEFFYKCDQFYSKPHEGGLAFNDPLLNIDWGASTEGFIVADRDRNWPSFGQHRTN